MIRAIAFLMFSIPLQESDKYTKYQNSNLKYLNPSHVLSEDYQKSLLFISFYRSLGSILRVSTKLSEG